MITSMSSTMMNVATTATPQQLQEKKVQQHSHGITKKDVMDGATVLPCRARRMPESHTEKVCFGTLRFLIHIDAL